MTMTMAEFDLISKVCETVHGYESLGLESFEAHDAVFVRNRETSRFRPTNFVGLIRTQPKEIDALFERVEREFAWIPHRRFWTDALTPPQIQARLTSDNRYSTDDEVKLVLEGNLLVPERATDIREVASEDDWEAYTALDHLWWLDSPWAADEEAFHSTQSVKRLKAPAVRFWLAFDEGVPAAFLASWPGQNGVGMVEDLFTHPDHRHRGLATALISHCVADARERGAGPIVIGADVKDTPKSMYAALGFRPLYLSRGYLRLIDQ